MIPEAQVRQLYELAYVWLLDLGIRPDMSIKVEF